ncbi:MAG: hypothetical protein KIG81_03930, partial [Thermoguttaceae bacterium]|nr:hypothetical protein [Thermoguttaceae bacterium]
PRPSRPSTFAFFQLEDLESTIRCAVWADAYAKYGQFIRPDAVVFLRGRVDKKESSVENEEGEHEIETTFFVDEIIPYENATAELSRGVAIYVKEEVLEAKGVKTLYDVLRTYRNGRDGTARGGDLEIWLELRTGTRAHFRCPEFKLTIANELRLRIEETFGKGSFRLLPAPQKQARREERQVWRRRKAES